MSSHAGGLKWKMQRLSVMTMAELCWRIRQFIWLYAERFVVAIGWQPSSSASLEPCSHSLFRCCPDVTMDVDGIHMLLSGRVDFFSQSPIEIGQPVNWHQNPLDQTTVPQSFGPHINYRDDQLVGDVKILWEMGREQHLLPLAAAYALHGDELIREHIINEIAEWVQANPFASGVHWCSTLEVSLRLISWSVIQHLLLLRDGGDGLPGMMPDRPAFERAVFQHQWFIRQHLSLHSSANNHYIGELSGLWLSCVLLPSSDVRCQRWRRWSKQQLEVQAMQQVFSDGVNKEQAMYYHLWVLEYFLLLHVTGLRMADAFSTSFVQRIAAMAGFLRDVMPEHGEPPQIGDSDDGFVLRFEAKWPQKPYHDVLVAAGNILHDPSLIISGYGSKAMWYAAMIRHTPLPVSMQRRKQYPRIYQQGGYAVLGHERMHVLFDAGSLGYPAIAAHGHADALSVTMAIDGQWWLVDPGTYAYHSKRQWRDYFRSTLAHNTMTLAGKNQSDIGGPFLWLRHAHATLDYAHGKANGQHDGYHHLGISHQRQVYIDQQAMALHIEDEVTGAEEQLVQFCFHLHPEVTMVADDDNSWLLRRQNTSGAVILRFQVNNGCFRQKLYRGNLEPLAGWYSSSLGKKEPTNTFVISVDRGQSPVRTSFIFTYSEEVTE